MISADTIRTIAANKSIHPGVIEKDYVLSKTLMSLAAIPEFRTHLVFKGGTALKKCYYPHWRYSEDLDFTAKAALAPSQIRDMFTAAVDGVSSAFGLPMRVSEFSQYPKDVEAIVSAQMKLSYDGPLRQSSGQKNNIRVDIALNEEIVLPTPNLNVVQEYADDIPASLPTYALEEVVAEKLRSILQRGKSRDYYDVWILLKEYGKDFDHQRTKDVFLKKCHSKDIPEPKVEDFFNTEQLAEAERFWERGLAHQLTVLPAFDTVLKELKSLIIAIAGETTN
ncbi:MAG: nucleotidyl transferase AbiEii/AbiGii toxin family protein [candidate division Zixibacteria bacterium]|jgi:predicted nucleotidyltransferase component of viral defense system|nr:nucleotidyl transferase AbiEii/AbiGii toxin family protein [candidate division Zixibacteria bacterium]